MSVTIELIQSKKNIYLDQYRKMKNPFPFHQTSFHYHDLKSPTHLEEGESYRPFLNKQVFDGSCRCTVNMYDSKRHSSQSCTPVSQRPLQ